MGAVVAATAEAYIGIMPQTQHPTPPPWRILSTTAHLAFLGTFGVVVLSLAAGYTAMAVGFIPLAGIGLLMLAAFVYVLYGFSWWETARVNGLYRLTVPLPRFAPRPERNFKGWLLSLWRQLGSGPMWLAIANLVLASVLGLVDVVAIGFSIWAATLLFSFITGWGTWLIPPALTGNTGLAATIGILLLGVALAVALALLHRTMSISILTAGSREKELQAQARASKEQHTGAVRAADVERSRIERDLHDGVQPRLVSVGMTLGLAGELIDTDPAAAKELVSEAHTSTKAAITELRQLARGIHTSVLEDRGLDAALSALAGRSHIPVHLEVDLPRRVDTVAESALYFVIAESLTNAAKHSRASACRITVKLLNDPSPRLWAWVADNGIGGARVIPGGGLDGITNRVLAAGGTINLSSPEGGPTTIEVAIPCGS